MPYEDTACPYTPPSGNNLEHPYFPDSTLPSVGGVGGESAIGAAGSSGGGAAGAPVGLTGAGLGGLEPSLRRAPWQVRLPPGRIS